MRKANTASGPPKGGHYRWVGYKHPVVSTLRWTFLAVVLFVSPTFAQTSPPMESVTLEEAVQRALKNNPTVAQAAEDILRAEALLQQARSGAMPTIRADISGVMVDQERRFNDIITTPRTQGTLTGMFALPVLAASAWAAASQARDQVGVSVLASSDVRTNLAVATAQAYLAVIAQKRQVEVSLRARETSIAHLDYARRRLEAGAGTRLNELRAGSEVATNQARLENSQLAVRRAQEALGVLMAANGPVDAAAEPIFQIPGSIDEAGWMKQRPDVQLFAAEERAADRVWRQSSRDWFPTANLSFQPQALVPASIFTDDRSWRVVLNFSQPLFDGGQRRGLRRMRQANYNRTRFALQGLQIQARSEVRLAQETVRSTERALLSMRSAADQANEVLKITNFAFEAGATTNLEVIDAQRHARDADSSAAVARDAVDRARLDLLTSLGRFPQ